MDYHTKKAEQNIFGIITCVIIMAIMVMIALVGCANLPSAQQQFNALCPTVTADLQTISVSPMLTPPQQALAAKAHDLNVKICSAGSAVDVTDLKTLANTLLPQIVMILNVIPPTPYFPSQAIALGLGTFGPLALQLAEQIISTTHPASAPPAASAPVPASS